MVALIFWLCVCSIIFAILSLIKIFYKKITWKFILKVTILFSFVSLFLLLVAESIYTFCTRPMTVRKYNIGGNYVINRDFFKGKNTGWQYEHYWIKISDDTLYLNIMNNNVLIKTYKRPIIYIEKGKHTFIEFYDTISLRHAYSYEREIVRNSRMEGNPYYRPYRETIDTLKIKEFVNVSDSVFVTRLDSVKQIGNHHMLEKNPLLHADAFSFNVVLQSTKYGNMFFKKGKWEKLKNNNCNKMKYSKQ